MTQKADTEDAPNIRPPTTQHRRLLKRFIYALLFLMVLGSFQACVRHLHLANFPKDPSLPPSEGFARYELGPYNFRIPVAYLYTVYEMRGNRWLKDSAVQAVDGGVIFDVFLPAFTPYGPEVHGNLEHINDRHIFISLSTDETGYPPNELIKRLEPRAPEQQSPLAGLREFNETAAKQRHYFQEPLKDSYFRMICNGALCRAWVVYHEYPALKVHYSFNATHLHDWSQIHQGVKTLVGQFQVSTLSP